MGCHDVILASPSLVPRPETARVSLGMKLGKPSLADAIQERISRSRSTVRSCAIPYRLVLQHHHFAEKRYAFHLSLGVMHLFTPYLELC